VAGRAAELGGELADAQAALPAQVAQSLTERGGWLLPHGGILGVDPNRSKVRNPGECGRFRIASDAVVRF
jgi:hypothetical protein